MSTKSTRIKLLSKAFCEAKRRHLVCCWSSWTQYTGQDSAQMCSAAGISEYKTNHSLHVTLATRLFKEGVDEQRLWQRLVTGVLMVCVVTNKYLKSNWN